MNQNTETAQSVGSATDEQLRQVDAYWRAANYLGAAQIYLRDNPLLHRELTAEDIKPRLLGHWGTSPGLAFVHAHLNRLIKTNDLDVITVLGPGHGGPAALGCSWLDGTYSETYPDVGRDADGMRRLFAAFSARTSPARSTRAASSATASRTPSVPLSTTRT
jgi:xylulose-5-phosphate/fructose-6-phosphate phosphoketolase